MLEYFHEEVQRRSTKKDDTFVIIKLLWEIKFQHVDRIKSFVDKIKTTRKHARTNLTLNIPFPM